MLRSAPRSSTRAPRVFAYQVKDPERYGVVEFDADGTRISIEEKPKQPQIELGRHRAVFLRRPASVDVARGLKPSARGELRDHRRQPRSTSSRGELHVERLGRGVAWLDSGTYDSLLAASQFVQTLEQRQGLKVACIEEIAFRKGYIDAAQLERLADGYGGSAYGAYLRRCLSDHRPFPRGGGGRSNQTGRDR